TDPEAESDSRSSRERGSEEQDGGATAARDGRFFGRELDGAGSDEGEQLLLEIGGELAVLRKQGAVRRIFGEPGIERVAVFGGDGAAFEARGPESGLLLGFGGKGRFHGWASSAGDWETGERLRAVSAGSAARSRRRA